MVNLVLVSHIPYCSVADVVSQVSQISVASVASVADVKLRDKVLWKMHVKTQNIIYNTFMFFSQKENKKNIIFVFSRIFLNKKFSTFTKKLTPYLSISYDKS